MERLIFPEVFGRRVKAFFTGRSPGADPALVSKVATVSPGRVYMPIQRHTDIVAVIDSDLDPKIADAVITREKGLLIGVQTADCVPVLIHDRSRHVAAAVHAGWRGTAAEILGKTIAVMAGRFSSSPSDLVVAIGPAIRWCCYQVGYEVVEAVAKTLHTGRAKKDFVMRKGEAYCIDLQTANRMHALAAGVPAAQVWTAPECTFCLPDCYYSYRYAKGPTGRQGGFIGLF